MAVAVALAAADETTLISRADGAGGTKGNASSSSSSVSADGRFVAFTSTATNLDPADGDAAPDVYLRDTQTSRTILVSRASGAGGAKGNGLSSGPSISADGRFVAFDSVATNLDPADGDGGRDVYLRDTQTSQTILVSRANGAGGAKGNDASGSPSISADGRLVAFSSGATNLDAADGDALDDIYVRDAVANRTTLISRASGAGGAKGNGSSGSNVSISADGRSIAFDSDATNLDPGDTNDTQDVYVRDTANNQTTLVSRADGPIGAVGSRIADIGAISATGRFVAFTTEANNLDSADGDTTEDIYVRDTAASETSLISRADGADGAKGNAYSTARASISWTGRFVAFYSAATNLDPADTDATTDIFVRDTQTDQTILATRADGAGGAKGDGTSSTPSMSGDGRFVVFRSAAANLDPADTDTTADIFLRQLDVDIAAPETTIDSGPTGGSGTRDRTPTHAFSSSETPASFRCRLYADGEVPGAFGLCSGPGAVNAPSDALPEGPYVFEVRASDLALNTDPTPAIARFSVDRTDPNLRLKGKRKQRSSKQVKTKATANEDAKVMVKQMGGKAVVKGRGSAVAAAKKKLRLKSVTRNVKAGKTKRFKLKLRGKKTRKKVKKLLKRGKKITFKLKGVAEDGAGNRGKDRFRVTLRKG